VLISPLISLFGVPACVSRLIIVGVLVIYFKICYLSGSYGIFDVYLMVDIP
jgi:hypothetical protein